MALSKLAIQKIELSGRPLRIAIDVSIWQFQIQSGKGGLNPALRTLYYRLLRLLSLSIQPLFVFDGLDKPPFKRNARTNNQSPSLPNQMAKQMLELFGFPYLVAPGEAEAECALLQREGVVDAVLSEDVDTLMFGCTLSLRNWSSEGSRGSKCPTHIDAYHAKEIKESKAGLDREGMVLVALMSGGDYIPAGIPRFGIKVACEAARAGFGKELCSLFEKDTLGFRQWRERLSHELRTNESGHFRVKRKAFQIPEAFPDKAVLGYYTHPVVSSAQKIQDLKKNIQWDGMVDIQGLRAFVAKNFEWQHLSGAKKFIRGLAPALLIQRLWERGQSAEVEIQDSATRTEQEAYFIKAICGRRIHFSTDGNPELRVTYVPADIVGLDLDKEEQDDNIGIVGSDSETEALRVDDEDMSRSISPAKRRAPSKYEPSQPEKIWIMETFAKFGIPLMVETWEEDMKNPKKFASRKARERDVITKHGMKKGALDSFLKVTKPGINFSRCEKAAPITATWPALENTQAPKYLSSPGTDYNPQGRTTRRDVGKITTRCNSTIQTPRKSKTSLGRVQNHPSAPGNSPKSSQVNQWTLSQRPPDTFNAKIDSSKRYSALGIYGSQDTAKDMMSSSPLDAGDRQRSTSSPTPSEEGRTPVKNSEGTNSINISSTSRLIEIEELGLDGEVRPKSPLQLCGPHRDWDVDESLAPMAVSPISTSALVSSPLSPKPCETLDVNSHKSTSVCIPRRIPEEKGTRKFIALRESLEGSWKEMDHWEVKTKNPKMTYEGVEVVNLT